MVTREPLVDGYGRVHRDLRISVTDRCSLRCTYCMPEDGVPWLPRATMLSTEEIVRLADVAVSMGIEEVRLTGGEPLLRRDLVDVVAGLASLDPAPEISMTTNAVGLAKNASALREAGLTRVNVSLDTLRRDVFIALAKRDRLADTLAGIRAAADAGLVPVKINTVLMRGINDADADVVGLLDFALEHGYELRFIEQMPLDAQHGWDRSQMITGEEILDKLRTGYDLTAQPDEARGSAPAELFDVRPMGADPDTAPLGTVGAIASVTMPFCGSCDRVRLTADGMIRNCLFAAGETDLRTPLRDGADDDELAALLRASITAKLPGHGINQPTFLQPPRPMSAIGG
ncbi:Molybdenum cofactor biosynthesis protein MoaA [Serinicoccus hydrothermalis]|uniref:GTP 3',8-cyclase n=1 Tax=Serinicoccus hydrothermalis TaxID=1758689 RepID=A0A1B1NDX5_9MICO|nr:GTP 3',8-cyclase MoaA [Serinicoccus hydrothermalis]ANS79648.1 Molybdenum cofactor biosynthesis protein MoaA [Serinicoccus hydrothermalis]